jgi:predicted porin
VRYGHVLKGNGTSTNDLTGTYANGPLAVAVNYNKPKGGEKSAHVGARYTVGPVTIAGAIVDPAGVAKGFSLGAGMKAGPVNVVLDVARDTHFKDTDLLVEVKYPVSKRTTAYAAFQRNGKGKGTATADVNNVGLGIRHNF